MPIYGTNCILQKQITVMQHLLDLKHLKLVNYLLNHISNELHQFLLVENKNNQYFYMHQS